MNVLKVIKSLFIFKKTFIKILLLICMCYQICDQINNYLLYEVVIDYKPKNQFFIPSFTICQRQDDFVKAWYDQDAPIEQIIEWRLHCRIHVPLRKDKLVNCLAVTYLYKI